MTPTLQKQKALIDGGFTEQEISDWQVEQRRALGDAGFSQAEIDTEFGEPPLDPKPAAKVIRENIEKAIAADTKDGQPKPVKDFMEALDAGFQGSVTGLLTRGKTPDKALAEDAPMASRIAGSIGALAGDIPAMIGGAISVEGAGPSPATAGAFALPAGMRKVITDAYEKGEATNWTEFWERASGAIIETAKGYIIGAATGVAGKVAGMLPIASPTAKVAATLSDPKSTTMVTVGKALEGEVPTADDFIDAAIVVGGVKGAVKTAKKMRDVYSKAGVKPDEFIADTERDVTIGQDFVAENLEVPRAYGNVTAASESPESVKRTFQRYDMATEDAGVVPVQVVRNADGSVSIIDLGPNGRNTEYPAAFVKDKSDEALLQYTYEPIGFQGATATGGSGKPPAPPRTPPPPDSPEAAREKCSRRSVCARATIKSR
jgi:hypothetical protein